MEILEFDQYGLCNNEAVSSDLFVSINMQEREEHIPLQQQTIFNSISDETQVFESIMEQCNIIAEKLNVHPLVAYMILESKNWNLHLVYEQFANYEDLTLTLLGIDKASALVDPSLKPHSPSDELFECSVCFCDCSADQFLALPCGHYFCSECWKGNLTTKIGEGQHHIKCMEAQCNRTVPPNSIKLICGDEIYGNLMHYIMDNQVSLADTFTNCPKPTCSKPVNALETHLCNVLKCSCGHEFCSLCHEQSHSPATCAEKEFWTMITNEDIMQQRLFGPNVKKCPQCLSIIEKNGGCNHMTCMKCRHEFCWMCMRAWNNHPHDFYHCQFYKKEDDPFLKKPDNIDREFLSDYSDAFIKMDMDNKIFLSNMPQLTNSIIKKLGLIDTDQQFATESISKLLDLIYWTKENIKWGQVHLFYKRYLIVKDVMMTEQKDTKKYPNTTDYQLLDFCLKNTIAALDLVEKRLNVQAPNIKKFNLFTLLDMYKHISAHRNTMLKHCDPTYQ